MPRIHRGSHRKPLRHGMTAEELDHWIVWSMRIPFCRAIWDQHGIHSFPYYGA